MDAAALADYATVGVRVRQVDAAEVVNHAGWRLCGRGEWKALGDSLTARAMEHDDPTVLFGLALDHLRSEHIVRPGLDRLQRAVATARRRATAEVYLRCRPFLTDTVTAGLDGLCQQDPGLGVAPIVWISGGATSAAPEAIKSEIAKLARLNEVNLPADLGGAIAPERQRHLARIARRSSPAALRRLEPLERYPTLIAWILVATSQVIDEIVQQYDLALAGTDHRVRHLVTERHAQLAAADLDRLELLDEILTVVLDDTVDDITLGHRLRALDHDRLTTAVRPIEDRRRRDGGVLALLEARYSHIRSFAPHVLATLDFAASVADSELLGAVQLLQQLNRDGLRRLPVDAPAGFIPTRWRGYLDETTAAGDDTRRRHYWELATLYQLRDGLRSGEIWVQGSRRYRDPASYLISPVVWPTVRDELGALSDQPATYAERLETLDVDLDHHLGSLDELLTNGDGLIALDADGQLKMSPLPAETIDADIIAQRDALAARLPRVPITDLLIEIDAHTHFSDHLTHAAGSTPRVDPLEHRRNLYAAILAQACNLGVERTADLTGISADTLTWTTRWYLRDDTVRDANTAIVDAHHRQPLAAMWGGGTLSSSDGMRLPMRGQSLTARRLSRYFVDEGVTQYTHVSDQHTTYGTQVIVTTDRDATYTLDGILGNTTELPIAEHTTDTHGQTLLTFGLYDLVGLRLSPRIARLNEHRLWRPHPAGRYQQWRRAGPLLVHPARTDLIAEHWDDLQRLGASLKTGHATASLVVARLQAGSRQHPLARALVEHGKLLRTVHTLRWCSDVEHRRRMHRQLNRGEALHDLRRFIAFAHSGEVRHRQHDDQTTQAHCHTLVVNACVLWTTTYLQYALDDGPAADEHVLAHTSPARYAHINPYGTYTIDIPAVLAQPRRPLRPAR